MAFFSDALANDPKRQYRFVLYIDTLGSPSEIIWFASKAEKPKMEIKETEHKYLNHSFFFPGGIAWSPVKITIVDPVSPDAAANTAAIIRASGYSPPANANDTTTISKHAAVTRLGGVKIAQIDSVGQHIEEWTLKNAWIQKFEPGELDYEGDKLSTIDLTFRYDWAVLKTLVKSTTGVKLPDNVTPGDGDEFWQI